MIRQRNAQSLLVGIHAPELNSLDSCANHAVDGIGAAAAHAKNFYRRESLNFNFVKTLHAAYGLPVGILDHTEGETFLSKVVPLLTPFVGAQVIEKHFVLDRSLKGIDYESSVNPNTLKDIVANLRAMGTTFGSGFPIVNFNVEEQAYRDLMKKAIVAEINIPANDIIKRDMVSFKRAGPGLRPMDINTIIGKKTKRAFTKNEKILREELQ